MYSGDIGDFFVNATFKFDVHHRGSEHWKDLFLDSDDFIHFDARNFDLSGLHVVQQVFVHEVYANDVVIEFIDNNNVVLESFALDWKVDFINALKVHLITNLVHFVLALVFG